MYLQLTKRLQSIISKLPAVVTLVLIILIWQLICSYGSVPEYMLPQPGDVMKALINDWDKIVMHGKITITEALIGLGFGIIIAFVMATMMDRFNLLNKAFYPILVITQAIPTVAIAPILILWLGFEMEPKIALVIITTFFPITVGLLDGYKSVDEDSIKLMRAMGAGRLQIFVHAKIPAALPHFFSGLKISASYSVVGAVVAEWLGGFEGLGVYMTRVRKAYTFDKMFAVIFVIVAISLLLMLFVNILRSICMPWENVEKKDRK